MYASWLWNPNDAAPRELTQMLEGLEKRHLFHSENAVTPSSCAAPKAGL